MGEILSLLFHIADLQGNLGQPYFTAVFLLTPAKPCQFTCNSYFVLCFFQTGPSVYNLRKLNICYRYEGNSVKKIVCASFHPKVCTRGLGESIRTYFPFTVKVISTDSLGFQTKLICPGAFLKVYLRADRTTFLVILTLDWDYFLSILSIVCVAEGSTQPMAQAHYLQLLASGAVSQDEKCSWWLHCRQQQFCLECGARR